MAIQGDTVRLGVEFRDFDGYLVDPSSITLKIYSVKKEILLSISITASDKVSTGIYEYDYVLPFGHSKLYYEWGSVIGTNPAIERGTIDVEFVGTTTAQTSSVVYATVATDHSGLSNRSALHQHPSEAIDFHKIVPLVDGNDAIEFTKADGTTEIMCIDTIKSRLKLYGQIDGFQEVNVHNTSTGTSASSDLVVTGSDGDEENHYFDMGINGQNFNDPTFTITGAGGAYLYADQAELAIGSTGTLPIKFFIGGTLVTNEVMRITQDGKIGIGEAAPTSYLTNNGSEAKCITILNNLSTLNDTHHICLCDSSSPFTVNLPAAATCPGRIYVIKMIGTDAITIEPNGTETIDGQSNIVISTQYRFKKLTNDSQNWFIIGGL